ncbi:hypothetical protein [Methylobrevis albus]|nr:hypothetical protein [Methylobrevis albus]
MPHPLIGRQIIASIGEPWDFCSAAGQGRLDGTVIDVFEDGDGRLRAIIRCSAFVHNGVEISVAAASERYAIPFALHERNGANLAFFRDGSLVARGTFPGTPGDSTTISWLIGSFQF